MRHVLIAALVVVAASAEAQTVSRTACQRVWDYATSSPAVVCDSVSLPPVQPPPPETPFCRGPGTVETVVYGPSAAVAEPLAKDNHCGPGFRMLRDGACELRR